MLCCLIFLLFKQKTAYEMRISDWSSDVCSSDLRRPGDRAIALDQLGQLALAYGGGHIDIIFLLGAGESAPPAIGGRVRQSLSDFLPTLRRAAMLRSEERRVGKGCVR